MEPKKGPRGPKKGLPRVGGRAAGTPNKATIAQKITISDAAKVHTEFALGVLVSVATKSPNDSARVSAASALLDRAYGKPAQAVVGESGGPVEWIFRWKGE